QSGGRSVSSLATKSEYTWYMERIHFRRSGSGTEASNRSSCSRSLAPRIPQTAWSTCANECLVAIGPNSENSLVICLTKIAGAEGTASSYRSPVGLVKKYSYCSLSSTTSRLKKKSTKWSKDLEDKSSFFNSSFNNPPRRASMPSNQE